MPTKERGKGMKLNNDQIILKLQTTLIHTKNDLAECPARTTDLERALYGLLQQTIRTIFNTLEEK